MPLINLDLTAAFAIDRGLPWELELLFTGDATRSQIRGQIRSNTNNQLLSDFQVANRRHDPTTGTTTMTIRLTAQQTQALPLTTGELHHYDLILSAPGSPAIALLGGRVQVGSVVTA